MTNDPLHVHFLSTAAEVGGGNRSLLTLAAGLQARGVHVSATCPAEGRFPEECRAIGVQCSTGAYPEPSWSNPAALWREQRDWAAQLKEGHVDIVHANDPASGRAFALACRSAKVPMVCHVRFGMTPELTQWVFRKLPKPRVFIFNSQALRDELAADFDAHLSGPRREVVPNAVDIEKFFPDPDPGMRRRVGILANLIPVKGHEDFLRMARVLVEQGYEDVEFRIIGKEIHGTDYGDVLRQRSRELGLDHVVDFAGYRDDVPAALNELDVLVCASHVEPFGRSLIEAMSCALPVVATRVGGIPEVVEHGVTGTLVPPQSPGALAGAVAALLDDEALRTAMGAAGRKRAHSLFGVDVHVDRILEIYRSL